MGEHADFVLSNLPPTWRCRVTLGDTDAHAPLHEQRRTRRDDGSVGVLELDHQAVRDRLSDYLEESLSEGEHARIREHLDSCPSCQAFSRTLERVVELAAQLPPRRLSDQAKRDLLDQVRAAAQ